MTETFNDYFANVRNHSEVLEEAQKIHPEMKVRLVGNDEWEMYMPTSYTENHDLSEAYKGTAAWEAYKTRDSGYDNELERYRHKQGYSGSPLEAVADIINLQHDQHEWVKPVKEAILAEHGLSESIFEEMWKKKDATEEETEKSNEIFSQYQRCVKEAYNLGSVEFEAKWAALKEKWEL